jgi:hypothetical protein
MTSPTPPFGSRALADLRARTEYEAWLLEAVYDITDQRIAVENVDELIYPPSGGPPAQTIYGFANIIIGDWRPGFLEAGAPLVFVTAFKILDMLLEWVLSENGRGSTHSFQQKIAALRGSIQFPPIIASRPWLQERLVALYSSLEPLRGTIIHARHFKSNSGALQVSSSKRGAAGPAVAIAAADLRNLAVVLVSLLRYLDGTWVMDAFREKRVRRAIDELAQLHGLPSLRQRPPGFLNVRLYVSESASVQIDLDRIRADITAKRPTEDVVFDLRVITVSSDGSRATGYLIPWSELEGGSSQLQKSIAEVAHFTVPAPSDFNLKTVAQELSTKG